MHLTAFAPSPHHFHAEPCLLCFRAPRSACRKHLCKSDKSLHVAPHQGDMSRSFVWPLQISRRLARRVNRDLAAGRWGFVQIAVAAYIYLLEHLSPGNSSLFGKEVICQRVAKPVHFYSGVTACAGRDPSASDSPSESPVVSSKAKVLIATSASALSCNYSGFLYSSKRLELRASVELEFSCYKYLQTYSMKGS